jgi:hypothetical protein
VCSDLLSFDWSTSSLLRFPTMAVFQQDPKQHLVKCPDLAIAEKRYRDHLVCIYTYCSNHDMSLAHITRLFLYKQDDCSHRLGGDHPDTIAAVNTLALLLFRSRKLEESEHLYVFILSYLL